MLWYDTRNEPYQTWYDPGILWYDSGILWYDIVPEAGTFWDDTVPDVGTLMVPYQSAGTVRSWYDASWYGSLLGRPGTINGSLLVPSWERTSTQWFAAGTVLGTYHWQISSRPAPYQFGSGTVL